MCRLHQECAHAIIIHRSYSRRRKREQKYVENEKDRFRRQERKL